MRRSDGYIKIDRGYKTKLKLLRKLRDAQTHPEVSYDAGQFKEGLENQGMAGYSSKVLESYACVQDLK